MNLLVSVAGERGRARTDTPFAVVNANPLIGISPERLPSKAIIVATNSKAVSIHPSTFADPSIVDLTAGDVVRMYLSQETKRKRDSDNPNELDVAVSFRSVPEGLLESLDDIHNSTGFSQSIVTRCLSHHVMAWYQSMPQIALLTHLYKTVCLRSDGFPDVVRKMKRDDYEFAHPRTFVTSVRVLRTVSFVMGYLGEIGAVLGILPSKLLLSGLCWSLSTNVEGWSSATITKFLSPEADNLQVYLGERVLVLDHANKLLKLRRGDKQVMEYVRSLRSQEWE